MFKLCDHYSHLGSIYNDDGIRLGCGYVDKHCIYGLKIGFFKCRSSGRCEKYSPKRRWEEIMENLKDQ